MDLPTLPSLWTDTLAMVNSFLSWDIVHGILVMLAGLFLGSRAMAMIGRALH